MGIIDSHIFLRILDIFLLYCFGCPWRPLYSKQIKFGLTMQLRAKSNCKKYFDIVCCDQRIKQFICFRNWSLCTSCWSPTPCFLTWLNVFSMSYSIVAMLRCCFDFLFSFLAYIYTYSFQLSAKLLWFWLFCDVLENKTPNLICIYH